MAETALNQPEHLAHDRGEKRLRRWDDPQRKILNEFVTESFKIHDRVSCGSEAGRVSGALFASNARFQGQWLRRAMRCGSAAIRRSRAARLSTSHSTRGRRSRGFATDAPCKRDQRQKRRPDAHGLGNFLRRAAPRKSQRCGRSIRLSHWMPPQKGIAPRIRIGQRWFNTLWTSADRTAALLCLMRSRKSARASRRRGLYPGTSRHSRVCAISQRRLSLVAAASALPEHVLHAVHHAGRPANPGRLPRLYWRRDCTPGSEWFCFQVPSGRANRTAKDDSSRCQPARHPGLRHTLGLSRWWHFSVNLLVADQRRRLLRPAVFDRPVASWSL